jgi:hypothetical protein
MEEAYDMEEGKDMEEMDLDELLRELEGMEEGEKEEMMEGEEDLINDPKGPTAHGNVAEEEDMEMGEEDEEMDLENMTEEDLKSFIESVIADMVAAGELEGEVEGGMGGDEMEMEDEEEVDIEELLAELMTERKKYGGNKGDVPAKKRGDKKDTAEEEGVEDYKKESVVTEAKSLLFSFDYNSTDEDDVDFIQGLLKDARVDAIAQPGFESDETVIKAKNEVELRKAKKVIQANGFKIYESVVTEDLINEDLSTGLVILLSAASVVGAIKGHIAAVGGVDDFTPIKDLKAWWQERKSDKALKSIINKIKDDEDVVEFMKLTPAQQRGKFRSLIATKLSDNELEYLNKINRSHFQKEAKKMEEQLAEANKAINTIRAELNEVNLLNAKLLYTNKIFKARTLSESQKVKVLEAFDKAATIKEVKLVFEILSNSAKEKKTSINESMFGGASKASGVAPTKKPILEVNDQFSRWQKLAGIK